MSKGAAECKNAGGCAFVVEQNKTGGACRHVCQQIDTRFAHKGREVTMSKTDAFYHRAKHRRWRRKVIDRAEGLCEECKRYGRVDEKGNPITADTAHHIKPAEQYPELRYVLSNGMALCEKCHNTKHPEKGQKARGTRYPRHP